eukprot:751828-Hanusia_phi.AAC.8
MPETRNCIMIPIPCRGTRRTKASLHSEGNCTCLICTRVKPRSWRGRGLWYLLRQLGSSDGEESRGLTWVARGISCREKPGDDCQTKPDTFLRTSSLGTRCGSTPPQTSLSRIHRIHPDTFHDLNSSHHWHQHRASNLATAVCIQLEPGTRSGRSELGPSQERTSG